MRDIKFRAWVVGLPIPEMLDVDTIGLPSIVGEVDDGAILMQYTGLKDKNGVEIYEGDILKGGVYKTYVVKWDWLSNHQNVGFNISYMVKHEFEVIGNIYENPELLESK